MAPSVLSGTARFQLCSENTVGKSHLIASDAAPVFIHHRHFSGQAQTFNAVRKLCKLREKAFSIPYLALKVDKDVGCYIPCGKVPILTAKREKKAPCGFNIPDFEEEGESFRFTHFDQPVLREP